VYTDAVFLKCIGDSSAEATALMKREGIRSRPIPVFFPSL
jgi:hypothetical protein